MNRNEQSIEQQDNRSSNERQANGKRPYRAPEVMVMDEKEVLKVFQVTSASISWWG